MIELLFFSLFSQLILQNSSWGNKKSKKEGEAGKAVLWCKPSMRVTIAKLAEFTQVQNWALVLSDVHTTINMPQNNKNLIHL